MDNPYVVQGLDFAQMLPVLATAATLIAVEDPENERVTHPLFRLAKPIIYRFGEQSSFGSWILGYIKRHPNIQRFAKTVVFGTAGKPSSLMSFSTVPCSFRFKPTSNAVFCHFLV
jgi:hypothetical protein